MRPSPHLMGSLVEQVTVVIVFGLAGGMFAGRVFLLPLITPSPVSGVPVAPGVVRYWDRATASYIFVCAKPCAVLQGERDARTRP